MKLLTVSLILILPIGCSQKPSAPKDISHDEYDVFAAVIDRFADSTHNKYAVVSDSTMPSDPLGSPWRNGKYVVESSSRYSPYPWHRIERFWPEMDTLTYQRVFGLLNRVSVKLELDSIHAKYPTKAVFWTETSFRSCGASEAYERGDFGVFRFSRAAVHPSGTEAMVYAEYQLGYTNGAGVWCWCKKFGGRWVVLKFIETWVS
jgi:hypothetical protein